MGQITSDPSARLRYYFRKARTSIPKVLTFLNEDESPYDISPITFRINFIDPDTNEVAIVLTEADGITKVDNTLTFGLTDQQSDVSKDLYWWELLDETNNRSWIYDNAYCLTHQPLEDTVDTTDITIRLMGENVTIIISSGEGLSAVDGGII